MTTAMVSMKAVVSHWTVLAVRSRSTISTGRATPMMVSLRMTTKVATSSVAMTLRSRLRSRLSATSVVVMSVLLYVDLVRPRGRQEVGRTRQL